MSIPIGSNLAVGAVLDGITAAGFLSVDADGIIQNPGEFGTVGTAYIEDNAVTLAKMAQVATARILGRSTAGTGNVEAVTVAQLEALLYASQTPQKNLANSYSALQTLAAAQGLLLTPGAAPASPAQGQMWYDATKNCPMFYDGTASRPMLESGTWTPTLAFATPGDLSVAYSTQVGRYRKIGRLLFIYFHVVTSTFTFTTASGAINLNGLPYTVGGSSEPVGSILMSSYAGIIAGASNSAMYIQASPNTATCLLRRQTPGSTAAASVQTTYQVASFVSGTQVTLAGFGLIGLVNES